VLICASGVACAQDYPQFYEREMEFRRTMGYPPHDAMVNVLFRGKVEDSAGELWGRARGPGASPST
jgi:primosomal protein N'